MSRCWVALALLTTCSLGCACGAPPTDDAASIDGGPDAAWIFWDSSTDTLDDAGACWPWHYGCQSDEECLRWGAFAAPAGTWPVTHCLAETCTAGTTNCSVGTVSATCLCSSEHLCADGEMCVSDTQGGPGRCVQACQGH